MTALARLDPPALPALGAALGMATEDVYTQNRRLYSS